MTEKDEEEEEDEDEEDEEDEDKEDKEDEEVMMPQGTFSEDATKLHCDFCGGAGHESDSCQRHKFVRSASNTCKVHDLHEEHEENLDKEVVETVRDIEARTQPPEAVMDEGVAGADGSIPGPMLVSKAEVQPDAADGSAAQAEAGAQSRVEAAAAEAVEEADAEVGTETEMAIEENSPPAKAPAASGTPAAPPSPAPTFQTSHRQAIELQGKPRRSQREKPCIEPGCFEAGWRVKHRGIAVDMVTRKKTDVWYHGCVVAVHADGFVDVHFDDGELMANMAPSSLHRSDEPTNTGSATSDEPHGTSCECSCLTHALMAPCLMAHAIMTHALMASWPLASLPMPQPLLIFNAFVLSTH